MKVYIPYMSEQYEAGYTYGVFSSEKLALEALREAIADEVEGIWDLPCPGSQGPRSWAVKEYELDVFQLEVY